MTTYTKTQLIDMAIQKLGESPDWENYRDIAVSTVKNARYGFGEFDICNREFVDNVYWQLVCTREEFEQRVIERKSEAKPTLEWQYCPECGSYEVSYEEGVHKQCADCSQEWFSDVDYTDVVRSHLQDNYLGESKPNSEWWDYENNEPLDFPPAGTECYYRKGAHPTYRWFVGKIMYTSKFVAVVRDNEDGIDVTFSNSLKLFKPIPKLTERQQAGLKLYRTINWQCELPDDTVINSKRFEDYCKPFDLEMLK